MIFTLVNKNYSQNYMLSNCVQKNFENYSTTSIITSIHQQVAHLKGLILFILGKAQLC